MLLKRIDGKIYAMRDRCLHRGVKFSRKLECYTKDTVTCWYHGYTYRITNGELVTILAVPNSKLIGKCRVKTFPVTEAKGLVFVYVGDSNREPPPLAQDVPPWFLDDDMMILGIHRPVESNWRIGAENGFDSTHIFIHRQSPLIREADLALPLGLVPKGRGSFRRVEEPGGPKGVFDLFDPEHVTPVFTATIAGKKVLEADAGGANHLPHHISMWMPCALCVHPWPDPELTQYEWYVPVDGERHIYFQALGRKVASADEERRFGEQFETRWRPVALQGFNDDDVWAREAMQRFYADDNGWLHEQLFEADGNILEWRRLASRHNRGVQAPEHLR
jgi:carbazole 1,9a-dioxygenase terminal dioxygenase component